MSEELNTIKYVSKENLAAVYNAINSRFLDPVSVNGLHANSEGNILINSVALADYAKRAGTAVDLESITYIELTDNFLLRSSGGEEDILNGDAVLREIHGNSYDIEKIEPKCELIDGSVDLDFGDDSNHEYLITFDDNTFYNKLLSEMESSLVTYIPKTPFIVRRTQMGWDLILNSTLGNNTIERDISLNEWGINFEADGILLLESEFSFNLNEGQEAAHSPLLVSRFTSVGFNLLKMDRYYIKSGTEYYSNITSNNPSGTVGEETEVLAITNGSNTNFLITISDNSGNPSNYYVKQSDVFLDAEATLIGDLRYIVRTFNNNEETEFTLSTSSGSNYYYNFINTANASTENVAIENYDFYTKLVPNTFITPCDGIFTLKNIPVNASCMVNFVWTGKRLSDAWEAYESNNITFKNGNNQLTSIELDRVENIYDTFNLLTGKVTRNIATLTTTDNTMEGIMIPIIHKKVGSKYYYDVNSCKQVYGSNPSTSTLIPAYLRNLFILPTEESYSIYNDNNDYASNEPYKYKVNDFGLELINGKYIFGNSEHPLKSECKIIYLANLIDKLRHNVVTYTLQNNISDEGREKARLNLDLISVNCYVGKHVVPISIKKIDISGNVIEILDDIYSNGTDENIIIKIPSLGIWEFSTKINNINTSVRVEAEYYGKYSIKLTGKRYGFRRAKNNSNSANRITYLFDAKDFLPIQREGNSCILGDWKEFIYDIAAPYYRTNAGDIVQLPQDNLSGDHGDCDYLVGFKKYKYVARKTDDNYEYVIFSDEDLSNDGEGFEYECQAHSYYDSNNRLLIGDIFYWGMFLGSYSSTMVDETETISLRSVPSRSTEPSARNISNIATMVLDAGIRGYSIGYKAGWDYICDLITLVTKTDDPTTIFGPGMYSTDFINLDQNTSLSRGPFYCPDGNNTNRIFWIYDFYGHSKEPLLGFLLFNPTKTANPTQTHFYVKPIRSGMASNYLPTITSDSVTAPTLFGTFDSDSKVIELGYVKLKNTVTNTKILYISGETVNNQTGFVPTGNDYTASGSGISDGIQYTNKGKTLSYATFGIINGTTSSSNLSLNGPRALDFSVLTSATSSGSANSNKVRPRITLIR